MVVVAPLRKPSAQGVEQAEEVLLHVRYLPNAGISSIDGCPKHLSPREWLDRLLAEASEYYQILAGGRGFFRIPRYRFKAILGSTAKRG